MNALSPVRIGNAAAPAPPHASVVTRSDAELIRACAAFNALEQQRAELDYEAMPRTPEAAAYKVAERCISDAQRCILDAIERHPPATMAGVAALARCIVLEEAAMDAADSCTMGGRLIWHLVQALAEERA